MSFILDALKKSESDRQRQNGPALFEVRVAPPRTRLPLWAIAITLLLAVNLGVVMWMLLRHQGRAGAATGAIATVPDTAAGPATGAQPLTAASSGPPAGSLPIPVVATSAPATAAAPPATPLAPPAGGAAASAAVTAPMSAAAAAATAGTASGAADSTNAEDYAPAAESPASGLGNHVRRGTASGVPLYQDLTTTPGTQLPQLRLDLHVFAARPEERFVMINMHKLREGDTLPDGVHVDSITPEGAVLSFNGSKFLLTRD
jgi:general secretion pathway protein B